MVGAATAREVLDEEIARTRAKLGIPCNDSARAEDGLREMLERATRRRVAPAAFVFNDEIHVVAPPGSLRIGAAELPHVHLHEVEQRVPALERLRESIATLTMDDLIADPHLERAIAAVDQIELDRIPLAHAAAWLLRQGPLAAAPSLRETDWRAALATLTSGAVPPASLLATPDPDSILLSEARLSRARAADLSELAVTRPASRQLLVTRSDSMFRLSTRSLGAPAGRIDDVEAWQNALEQCLSSRTYQRSRPDERPWTGGMESPRAAPPDVGRTWLELDKVMAGVWLALRRASAATEAVEIHGGAILIHIGAGIAIELHVRRHAASGDAVTAAFGTQVDARGSDPVTWSAITSHVTTAGLRGSQHEPGYELPNLVYLAGKGYAAEITFAFTPWLATAAVAAPAFTAARAAVVDADEAARRAPDDD